MFIVSAFAVPDSNFKLWVDRAAYEMSGTADFSFDTITDEEIKVTQAEKDKCRVRYEENILTETDPAYNFRVGIHQLQNNTDDWNFESGKEITINDTPKAVIMFYKAK